MDAGTGNSHKETAFSINKGWMLGIDPDNIGRREEWLSKIPAEHFPDAPVPGIIQQVFPDYHGVAWYWNKFTPFCVPADHELFMIRFAAVDYYAEVWLNGVFIGSHEGGETPFECDGTDALIFGSENLLSVRVVNPGDQEIDGFQRDEVPHSNRSPKSGGITRAVEARIKPVVHVSDIYVKSDGDTGEVHVQAQITKKTTEIVNITARIVINPAHSGETDSISYGAGQIVLADDQTIFTHKIQMHDPKHWQLNDPFLYRASVQISGTFADGSQFRHGCDVRFGFRDFRVGGDGYFYLNGKRLFVRSTHTGNHVPVSDTVQQGNDFLLRDLYYAKAAGYNMVRFITTMPSEAQLDYCDEIGLMVYEENAASWGMAESRYMGERFDRAFTQMIMRDRNHPCVVIWGLLNERRKGLLFDHAAGMLPLIHSMDDTRLVLLNSGRHDLMPSYGSLCNPGISDWQYLWGGEAPDAPAVDNPGRFFDLDYLAKTKGFMGDDDSARLGDQHQYPFAPFQDEAIKYLREVLGRNRPVFLSECGLGSMLDIVHALRMYEQAGAREDLYDVVFFKSIYDRYVDFWAKARLDTLYAFPEDLLRDSQRISAKWRLRLFNAIRSNPKINGYSITGMLDHGLSGEGIWTFWREWKPEMFDALSDGFAPLRWCLFVDPMHVCAGKPFRIEATLANEDILGAGDYPVRFKIMGPDGMVWEKATTIVIGETGPERPNPLALSVLLENVVIHGRAGKYRFTATMEKGGAPAGGNLDFHVSESGAPEENALAGCTAKLIGIGHEAEEWLQACGMKNDDASELIVVGKLGGDNDKPFIDRLYSKVADGADVLFLEPVEYLPDDAGKCTRYINWLYHKEDIGFRHPVFDGLQTGGILDWDYYGQIIPQHLYEGFDHAEDTASVAVATGFGAAPDGFMAGRNICRVKHGKGHIIFNTFRLIDHVGKNPIAGKMILNLVKYAASVHSVFSFDTLI